MGSLTIEATQKGYEKTKGLEKRNFIDTKKKFFFT